MDRRMTRRGILRSARTLLIVVWGRILEITVQRIDQRDEHNNA